MSYAYLDVGDTVRAVSSTDRSLAEVQAVIPEVTVKISGAPEGLEGKESEGFFWHHKIGGDGTHLTDYERVDNLPRYRAVKNEEIDKRTREIIAQGAPYDGHVFSMDLPDQMTYLSLCLAVMAGQAVYPIEVRDMTDQPYYLVDATAYYTFFFTGLGYVQGVLHSGRVLKDQVNACATVACINSIVDPR
jgi:hypothetical protein